MKPNLAEFEYGRLIPQCIWRVAMRDAFLWTSSILLLLTAGLASLWPNTTFLLVIVVLISLSGYYDMLQKKHTILRLYPVIGRLRYVFEAVRPEMQQYFVEDDVSGTPVNREFRSLIYQRAKGVQDTRPFGTQFDVYRVGYEWTNHSLNPSLLLQKEPRVLFGEGRCSQPYQVSHFNISAMSYGALSKHAILALNMGAKIGGFYHNTGEGGISPYHLKEGGDLVWQIGTGYFSCRTPQGLFDKALFAKNAQQPSVKMIEVKLSQGAKPGHGGVLPAAKLTQEIADIRNVALGQDVLSPAAHSAFSNPIEMMHFIEELRTLSGGKPVGFKLSVGKIEEVFAICKAMLHTGIVPDFITVDGGEGGTGAAPIEFSNSLGTPLREALNVVHSALIGSGLREKTRLIASGKAFSAFHVFRLLALGADTVNSARGMMFALGCIQSRNCNRNICPTGVATQDPRRYKFLDINDKGQRVANYQQSIIKNLLELASAAGLNSPEDVSAKEIQRRISTTEVKSLAEIYPCLENRAFLNKTAPEQWQQAWNQADASHW